MKKKMKKRDEWNRCGGHARRREEVVCVINKSDGKAHLRSIFYHLFRWLARSTDRSLAEAKKETATRSVSLRATTDSFYLSMKLLASPRA